MAKISTLRKISASADAIFFAARAACHATIDECAAHYSDECWERLGHAELAFHAARDAMEHANAALEHAELVNVGVRK
jgi:hypothetical protein